MPASTGATKVRPVAEPFPPTNPGCRTDRPTLLDIPGEVAVLRRRGVVPVGALGTDALAGGRRLVGARDLHDVAWWIPAASVWSDAEERDRPEHPWHIGLATDRSWSRAVLSGLSGRLGWEARLAHERGEELPVVRDVAPHGVVTVFDGRLGHEVPTVHIVSEQVVRSGAGVTTESAYRRTLFGDHGVSEVEIDRELADVQLVLAAGGLHVAVVDLGTDMLRQAGIARVSVQLMGA